MGGALGGEPDQRLSGEEQQEKDEQAASPTFTFLQLLDTARRQYASTETE